MAGPLAGTTVLDLPTVVMGPYATQILGDLGAHIIKIEAPGGDNVRHVGPMRNRGKGHMFVHLNRNKKSVVLDLKQPAGGDALLRIAAKSDVLIYNIRPQAMQRLRLGYADVAAVNPRIIYVGAYGYGQQGPYAARPAYDDLIQCMAASQRFLAGAADEVWVVHSEFESTLTQRPRVVKLLPFAPDPSELVEDKPPFTIEPNAQALLALLVPKALQVEIYRALLDNQAGEHAARMTAMESATRNGEDMIGSLTLKYNRARQAAITKELMEIVSGAEAL